MEKTERNDAAGKSARTGAPDAGAHKTTAERIHRAFERSAAEAAEELARDPQLLALGAGVLRAQLLWTRSIGLAFEAAMAPFEALAAAAGGDGEARGAR